MAVKNIRDVFENKTEAKRLLRELKILRLLAHDQVVKIHDIIPPVDFMNFESLYVLFLRIRTPFQYFVFVTMIGKTRYLVQRCDERSLHFFVTSMLRKELVSP